MPRKLRPYVILSLIIAVVRVGAFVILEYRERSGTQSVDFIFLVLLLIPEGLILPPRTYPWLFALLLVVGSVVFASVFLLLSRLMRARR